MPEQCVLCISWLTQAKVEVSKSGKRRKTPMPWQEKQKQKNKKKQQQKTNEKRNHNTKTCNKLKQMIIKTYTRTHTQNPKQTESEISWTNCMENYMVDEYLVSSQSAADQHYPTHKNGCTRVIMSCTMCVCGSKLWKTKSSKVAKTKSVPSPPPPQTAAFIHKSTQHKIRSGATEPNKKKRKEMKSEDTDKSS